MPEYNSVRSYKRQVFNKYQFLLNSAIRLILNSQIVTSLGTIPHLVVSKGQPTVFSRQEGRAVQDSTKVSKRERHPNCAAEQHPLRLCDTSGARAGPTFPFAAGKCPTSSQLFYTSAPRETRHEILHLCAPVYTAAPLTQLGIILHAASHLFAELKHTSGINRYFLWEQKKSCVFDPRGRSHFYKCT